MLLAPIILFVYNRPWHTRQTVESLQKNFLATESELYIFSDGPKTLTDTANVQEVRKYIREIRGFREVHIVENPVNSGLATAVINGVTQVIHLFGKAIVLEDDMVCAVNFLSFMNDTLQAYQNNRLIFSISGYSYPIKIPATYDKDVYLLPRASSWGWATWADRWSKVDWQVSTYSSFMDNRNARKAFMQGGEDLLYMLIKQQKAMINSWAIRWTYAHYTHQAYCLHLVKSKIHNIGADNSGTHTPKTTRYYSEISNDPYILPPEVAPNPEIIKKLQSFFKPSLIRKLINYFSLRVN